MPESSALTSTVDWGAAIRASLIAGLIALAMYLVFVPYAVGAGTPSIILAYLASVVAGPDVLAPPPEISVAVGALGIAAHLLLALVMGIVIAFVLHRWGLITGIFGGAAMGLMFFAINFYSLTLIYPHFFAMSHWSVALTHLTFGALAGGIYELLELEPGERDAV